MKLEILNDDNLKMHTNYKRVQATGMVPLLKPVGFLGPKPTPFEIKVDEYVQNLSSLNRSNMSEIFNSGYTGKGSVLAVLDTGVYAGHPDFGGRVILSMNYKGEHSQGDDINDMHGHGTHVAGLAAAGESNVLRDFSGIAPEARIVSVKVTDGAEQTTSWRKIADGLQKVLDYNKENKPENQIGCALICFNAYDNFAFSTRFTAQNNRLIKLFEECYDSNVVVVVSSGNHFLDFCSITARRTTVHSVTDLESWINESVGMAFPAVSNKILCAGATANADGSYPMDDTAINDRLKFSNGDMAVFSQRIRVAPSEFKNPPIFVGVPGLQMISLDNRPTNIRLNNGYYPQGYTMMSGTSQAAGVLAGMILQMQQKIRRNLGISAARVPVAPIFNAIERHSSLVDFDSLGHRRQRTITTAVGGAANTSNLKFRIADITKILNHI